MCWCVCVCAKLDLPFVHSVRVSEAKIRVLNTSNHLTNNSFVDDYYLNSSAQWSGDAKTLSRTTPRALTSRSHNARTHDDSGQLYNSETESVDNNHEHSYRSTTNGRSARGKYGRREFDVVSSTQQEDEREEDRAPALATYDRLNKLPNQGVYYIESLDRTAGHLNHSYQADHGAGYGHNNTDYNMNESMPPATPVTARKPPNPKSLFKKSKVRKGQGHSLALSRSPSLICLLFLRSQLLTSSNTHRATTSPPRQAARTTRPTIRLNERAS